WRGGDDRPFGDQLVDRRGGVANLLKDRNTVVAERWASHRAGTAERGNRTGSVQVLAITFVAGRLNQVAFAHWWAGERVGHGVHRGAWDSCRHQLIDPLEGRSSRELRGQ